jgi:hypothetical protein
MLSRMRHGRSPTTHERRIDMTTHHEPRTQAKRLASFIVAIEDHDPRALALLNSWEPEFPDEIVLDRTGDTPLRFRGALIREASSKDIDASARKPNQDYFTIKVYRVTSGPERFAVCIEYSTIVRKTVCTTSIATFTKDPLIQIIGYEPLDHLRGFPKTPEYANRQEHLEKTSKLQYGKLISEITRQPF